MTEYQLNYSILYCKTYQEAT